MTLVCLNPDYLIEVDAIAILGEDAGPRPSSSSL